MNKVSVIVTCYNYGQYIGECIQSIEEQTYDDIEIIIVDDCSNDEHTRQILMDLEDKYLVIWHGLRKGLASASNTGVSYSNGSLIMRMDADDMLRPECIEKMVEAMKQVWMGAAYSDYFAMYGKEIIAKKQGPHPLGSAMLYKRSIWEKTGGYDETLNYQEDLDFFLKVKNFESVCHLKEPLWYYRQHDKQMSNAHNKRMKVRQKILKGPKVLTVIPARGNSKEVPHKNLRTINGKTLVERAIDMVKDSGITTQLSVSSEDMRIREVAEKNGVDFVVNRPEILSQDEVSTIPVSIHAMDWMNTVMDNNWHPDIVITVQATCPFTPPEKLAEGLQKLIDSPDLDSVVSVTELHRHPWRAYSMTDERLIPYSPIESESFLQRQDRPKAYGFTGGFYIRRRKLLDDWKGSSHGFAIGKCAGIEVSRYEGLDIDTETDLLIAKVLGDITHD